MDEETQPEAVLKPIKIGVYEKHIRVQTQKRAKQQQADL